MAHIKLFKRITILFNRMVLINLVVSINQNNLIGINNDLLIRSKEDLKNFYKITTSNYPEGNKNIIIMGMNTWLSIPSNKRPLKNRMNIVLSQNRRDLIEENEDLKVLDSLFNALDWCNTNETGKVFVIGGESIYNQCYLHHQNKINMIYLTKFIENTNSTKGKIFPIEIFNKMTLLKETSNMEDCEVLYDGKYIKKELKTIYKIFQNNFMINIEENNYLNLLKRIINEGNLTQTRNSFTINTFGERMIFDMNNGFPLLTTKKMGYKTILRELLWFIKGSTSNQELLDKNVHIWSQNSSREFLDSRGLNYEEGDLGPVYGFQWRYSGAEYVDCLQIILVRG